MGRASKKELEITHRSGAQGVGDGVRVGHSVGRAVAFTVGLLTGVEITGSEVSLAVGMKSGVSGAISVEAAAGTQAARLKTK